MATAAQAAFHRVGENWLVQGKMCRPEKGHWVRAWRLSFGTTPRRVAEPIVVPALKSGSTAPGKNGRRQAAGRIVIYRLPSPMRTRSVACPAQLVPHHSTRRPPWATALFRTDRSRLGPAHQRHADRVPNSGCNRLQLHRTAKANQGQRPLTMGLGVRGSKRQHFVVQFHRFGEVPLRFKRRHRIISSSIREAVSLRPTE